MNKTHACAHSHSQQPDLIDFPDAKHVFTYDIDVTRIPVQVMENVSLSSPECTADYVYGLGIADYPQEHFVVLHLDTRNKILSHTIVTKGLGDRSHVHPREVFCSAILNGSSKIIIAHNHPSRDITSSKEGSDTTSRGRQAAYR